MQVYPVKPGHAKKTDLKQVFEDSFGSASTEDDWVTGSFAAFRSVRARYNGLKSIEVDTDQDRDVDMETGQKTIKAWNAFLEAATGYNAKQRGKKAQQAAKKEK